MEAEALPGAELVEPGLVDAARGRWTVAGLLVAIAAPRLRRLGLVLPPDDRLPAEPELLLYRALRAEGGNAYGRYNALLRRLVSFERALESSRRRSEAVGR